MIEDPIVAEIRRHRKEHAAKYGNDLKRIVEALRKFIFLPDVRTMIFMIKGLI